MSPINSSQAVEPPNLDALRPEVSQALLSWFTEEHLEPPQARDLLAQRYGVSVTVEHLQRWLQRRVQEIQCAQIAERCQNVNDIMAAFTATPADAYEAVIQLVGTALFDQMKIPGEKPLATLEDVAKLAISVQGLRLKARETSLEETKQRDQHALQLVKLRAVEIESGPLKPMTDQSRDEAEAAFNFF